MQGQGLENRSEGMLTDPCWNLYVIGLVWIYTEIYLSFAFRHSIKFSTLCVCGIWTLGLGAHLSSGQWAFHVEPPPLPGLHAPLGPVVADIRTSVVPVGGSLCSAGWWLALGSGRFSQRGVGGLVCVEFPLRETGFRPRGFVSRAHFELRWPVSGDVLVSILYNL